MSAVVEIERRWQQRGLTRGLFFDSFGSGEEIGVHEVCEAVREELAHVRDDPG